MDTVTVGGACSLGLVQECIVRDASICQKQKSTWRMMFGFSVTGPNTLPYPQHLDTSKGNVRVHSHRVQSTVALQLLNVLVAAHPRRHLIPPATQAKFHGRDKLPVYRHPPRGFLVQEARQAAVVIDKDIISLKVAMGENDPVIAFADIIRPRQRLCILSRRVERVARGREHETFGCCQRKKLISSLLPSIHVNSHRAKRAKM